MTETISEKVSPEMLIKFHNIAIHSVNESYRKTRNNKSDVLYKAAEFNLRGRAGTSFGLVMAPQDYDLVNEDLYRELQLKSTITVSGLKELRELMATEQGKYIKLTYGNKFYKVNDMSLEEMEGAILRGECSLFLEKDYVDNMNSRINASVDNYYNS